jgi:translation initiation factor IF-2
LASTRVYILAKELGVKSTAIVDKCKAEGLAQVENHMATISAGLAATIREWFSDNENVSTSVETAEKVDLTKVRVKRKKKVEKPEDSVETTTEEVAEQQLPSDMVATVSQEAEPVAVEEDEGAGTAELPGEEIALSPEVDFTEPAVEEVVAEPVEPEPEAEKPILPAGPMLHKPAPAQLTGPRVVRYEKPEELRPLRPSKGPRPMGPRQAGRSEPVLPGAPIPVIPGAKPAKGKDVKGRAKTHGRHKDGIIEEDGLVKGGKRRGQKDLDERRARLNAAEGERMRMRPVRKIQTDRKGDIIHQTTAKPEKVTVSIPITVKDLAGAMGVKISDIISKLMRQGVMAAANQVIASEVAEMVALEMGVELVMQRRLTLMDQMAIDFKDMPRNNLQKRPPVAAMLGHVDHGKTSLLDRIRTAHVADGEAGGITQHIGAYQVQIGEKKVTFLDTPGHAAFTAMRARGANMTDVVVLVCAADDGVMPQTVEAIHHAQAAEVPIIVALNKSDLPGTDINRIYGQLAEHGLTPTAWGGNVEVVRTSATTGMGVDELLEYIDYVAELKDFKADPTLPASGWVIEAKMTPTQGAVATLLVKEGTLEKGDVIVAGESYGRIRSMRDSAGRSVSTAASSTPVEVTGLDGVPQAGDRFYKLDDIRKAQTIAEESRMLARELTLARRTQVTLDNLYSQIAAGNVKELNLILRADVQGSVDVLVKYLSELNTDEVKIKMLHAGVGGITEGDVVLAEASGAIIIGFNVVPEEVARRQSEAKGVDIRLYNIIYRITEDLKKAMSGLLDPEEQEKYVGQAVVRNTFKVTGVGTVAGCYVTDGLVTRDAKIRLVRDNIVLKDDCKIQSLKHFKDDVREIRAGFECGIKIDAFDDVKVGDVFSVYRITKVARTLA